MKKLGEFVRKGDQNPGVIDSFTAAHLGSFAFGDLNVVLSTNRFMEDPSRANLMEILYAMRKGLQHTELELWFKEKYNYEILYEPVVTTHDTILNKKRKEERSDNES